MVVSSTISSPVPLPSRSGTSYSMTRARWMTGRPRSSNASGTVLMSVRSGPGAGGGQQPLPAPPPDRGLDQHGQVGAVVAARRSTGSSSWVGARHSSAAPVACAVSQAVPGVEAAVGGEQLIGAQPRVQPLRQGLLPDGVGVDLGGQEGVGAALGQRDHPGLGERRAVVPAAGVAELGGVLLAVGQVDLEPVDPQQPPPAQERPPRGAQRRHLGGRTGLPGDRAAACVRTAPGTRGGPAVCGPG